MKFHLRKTDGRRGYYRELWATVNETDKLFLGHEESGRYSRGSFLVLPESEVYEGFLIACDSDRRREEVKNLIAGDSEFREILKRLMGEKFSQITIGKEVHVGGVFLLKRVTVVRYFPVPEENVGPWERDLEIVAQKLGLRG